MKFFHFSNSLFVCWLNEKGKKLGKFLPLSYVCFSLLYFFNKCSLFLAILPLEKPRKDLQLTVGQNTKLEKI